MQQNDRIGDGATLLFMGARIRESDQMQPPPGSGYVRRFHDLLVTHAPQMDVDVIDRTIDDATIQLVWDRWHDDVLTQNPDWVILMVGTADAYQHLHSNENGEDYFETFKQRYTLLLKTTQEHLPTCRIVIMEPFIASNKRSAHTTEGKVLPILECYTKAIEDLAKQWDLPFIPCHQRIQYLKNRHGDEMFGPQSIHPDQQGSICIAELLAQQLISLPEYLDRENPTENGDVYEKPSKHILQNNNQTLLFIGDSITDCGRRGFNGQLGVGYVRLFSELLFNRRPFTTTRIINKGIGGNTILDLDYRWKQDVIDLAPNWLSIKIGINDTSHFVNKKEPLVTPEVFEEYYRNILTETKKVLPNCKILLISPFYMSTDTNSDTSHRGRMAVMVTTYVEIVRTLSITFNTLFIDTHSLFQNHLRYRHNSTFGNEPVHPNETGAMILAEAVYQVLHNKLNS